MQITLAWAVLRETRVRVPTAGFALHALLLAAGCGGAAGQPAPDAFASGGLQPDALAPDAPPGTAALATSLDNPNSVAVDSTSVYWTVAGAPSSSVPNGQVMKAPLAGGTPVVLASYQFTPGNIAIDATSVYWTDSGSRVANGLVARVPLAGGTPVVLASGQSPRGLAIDAQDLYWSNAADGTIVKAPLAGGPATILARSAAPRSVAVDGTSVYWLDDDVPADGLGSVRKVALSGGIPVTLAVRQRLPMGIAVDATSVYWLVALPGGLAGLPAGINVMAVPLGGGTPLPLASIADGNDPWALTVDRASVYFSDTLNVFEVSIAGGAPVTLASEQTYPQGIAVSATSVYWADTGSGRIMVHTPR